MPDYGQYLGHYEEEADDPVSDVGHDDKESQGDGATHPGLELTHSRMGGPPWDCAGQHGPQPAKEVRYPDQSRAITFKCPIAYIAFWCNHIFA